MKVLYVFRSLAMWGGIERILVEKMNYLSKVYGFDVYMLTSDQGNHSVPYHLEDSVHLEDLNIRFHQQYQQEVVKYLLDGPLLHVREVYHMQQEQVYQHLIQQVAEQLHCMQYGHLQLHVVIVVVIHLYKVQ